jgi:hypothetical protein
MCMNVPHMKCCNPTCKDITFTTEAEMADHLLASDICMNANLTSRIDGRCRNLDCKDITFETEAEMARHIIKSKDCWSASRRSGDAEEEEGVCCLECGASFPKEAGLAEHFDDSMDCLLACSRRRETGRLTGHIGGAPIRLINSSGGPEVSVQLAHQYAPSPCDGSAVDYRPVGR